MFLLSLLPLGFKVSPLFPSGIAELAFVLVFFLWFYFEIINQVYIAFRNKGSSIKIKNDKFSLFGIYFGTIMILYITSWFNGNAPSYNLPLWAFYLGLAMMIFGEGLRQWSTVTLGRFFTAAVIITNDHKLIIRGPYKFFRHPAYIGGTIAIVGISVAVRSWGAALIALAIMLLVYAYRIHFEEQALRKEFGRTYADYAKKTPIIIPRVF